MSKKTASKFSSFGVYFRSSLLTFIAAFAAATAPVIGDQKFSQAALLAIIFTGVRAGIKAVLEYIAILKVS